MDIDLGWLAENKEVFKKVFDYSLGRKELYLVGGILRDAFLRRSKKSLDADFCLSRGAVGFARGLSKELKCGFVVLDKEHGCARLVLKQRGKSCTLDFSDFRGRDIKEDLSLRDFTVNSMALALKDIFCRKGLVEKIIDPLSGMQDIRRKRVRMCGKDAFDDDPLRILRAFSLKAIFGFSIEDKTVKEIEAKKKKLLSVSGERVRDELFKIFGSAQGFSVAGELDKCGIIELLFPELKPMKKMKEGRYRRLDIWGHTMQTFNNLEAVFSDHFRSDQVRRYLEEELSCGRRRLELLKLVALLHDVAKPQTLKLEKGKFRFYGHERIGAYTFEAVARRLRLSNEEIYAGKKIIFQHLRPGYLANYDTLTARAKFRFFRDAGREAASVLLLSLADQRATKASFATPQSRLRHEKAVKKMLKEYFQENKAEEKQRLADGHDIMKHLKLEPSALVGKILRELEELQAIGKIKTKREALAAAAKMV